MMKTPPIVSQEEWEAARRQLLVKEKELTRARDTLAAERRRMPWMAVVKKYEFDAPKGKATLPDLFEDRRQLVVYRAPPYKWWNWHDNYDSTAPDPRWLDSLTDPQRAAERRREDETKGSTPS